LNTTAGRSICIANTACVYSRVLYLWVRLLIVSVRFLGTEVDKERGKLYIFMERVSGGSIKEMLENYGPLPENIMIR